MIALSDKLANAMDMVQSKREEGVSFWNKFNNSDPLDQQWYYNSFAQIISEKSNLSETVPYKKYVEVIEELFS